MRVDLHNHTVLCNHATGTVDEYVQSAIAKNTEYFGFSDHAPMKFDPEYRMRFDQIPLYEQWIHEAKEKYSDQITILCGYEVDYLQGYMDEHILNKKCDYLIGSVHFIDEWGFDNPEFIGRYHGLDMDQLYQRYFDLIASMAKFGKFDIVGHLDLLKVFGFLPSKDIRLLARDAIKAIKEANMVVELNVSGFRKPIKEAYPSGPLLELCAEYQIPITFGSDAHRSDQVGLYSDEITKLARLYGYDECAIFNNRDRSMIKF